jgi:small subunit ribosomal protein S18
MTTPTSTPSSPSSAPRSRGPMRPGGRTDEGARGPRRWGPPRRKVCRFCVDRVIDIDYKNTTALRNYITERGKLISARSTGNCAKHHRMLTAAIKRARNLALLPYLVVW